MRNFKKSRLGCFRNYLSNDCLKEQEELDPETGIDPVPNRTISYVKGVSNISTKSTKIGKETEKKKKNDEDDDEKDECEKECEENANVLECYFIFIFTLVFTVFCIIMFSEIPNY